MHHELQQIVDYIEATRDILNAKSRLLSQPQLDFRPSPEAWSVGETLDHLCKVESGVVRMLMNCQTAVRANLVPTLSDSFELRAVWTTLDSLPIERVTRRVKSPASVTPDYGIEKSILTAQMDASRRRLRETLENLKDYDLTSIDFPHPFFGAWNMYNWLLLIGKHERRHLAQIEAVLESDDFPAQ